MSYKHLHNSKLSKNSDEWMQRTWRPMMAILYMAVCGFDFIIAPILWSILQAKSNGTITSQWVPLTLQGGGLFHLAMGAVLGITAYGRTQEKLVGVTSSAVLSDKQDTNIVAPLGDSTQLSNNLPIHPVTPSI